MLVMGWEMSQSLQAACGSQARNRRWVGEAAPTSDDADDKVRKHRGFGLIRSTKRLLRNSGFSLVSHCQALVLSQLSSLTLPKRSHT